MAQPDTHDLMLVLLSYMDDIVNPGADGAPDPRYYVSWCAPGIPYEPEDLTFAQFGLGVPPGLQVKAEDAEAEVPATEDTPVRPEAGMSGGDHVRMQAMQAEMFARLANAIPDPGGLYSESQQLAARNTSGIDLEQVYGDVLQNIQVAATPLSDQEKETLTNINKRLTVMVDGIDPNTFETVKQPDASPLVKQYMRFAQLYEAAVMGRNNVRLAAMTSDDPMVVLAETLNGPTLDNQVNIARDRWVTQGHKLIYERMMSVKEQIEGRGLALSLREMRQEYERSLQRNPVTGGNFRFTSIVPPAFHKAQGWTKISLAASDYERHNARKERKVHGGGGVNLGLFAVGGNASQLKQESSLKQEASGMSVEFEICQVPIVRYWFKPHFLRLRSWRFPENMPDTLGMASQDLPANTVSLGPEDPRGAMPAYAVTAIFARNIRLHFHESNRATDSFTSKVGGGGNVRYGPFRLGGGAESSVSRSNVQAEFQGGSLVSDGMQVIGFKNHILSKAPDPDPSITEWVTDVNKILETLE